MRANIFDERMNKFFPKARELFEHMNFKGTLFQNARAIVGLLNLLYPENLHSCFAIKEIEPYDYGLYVKGITAEFRSNGVLYKISKMEKLTKVENFKAEVILAIDSAEEKGGSASQRLDHFEEKFKGKANIYIRKGKASSFFSYAGQNYVSETRDDITYEVWQLY